MINVFNIATCLIAIIGLILAIIANNKSTTNDFSDAKVMGPDGQQVSLGVSLAGYLNQQKGSDFMKEYLDSKMKVMFYNDKFNFYHNYERSEYQDVNNFGLGLVDIEWAGNKSQAFSIASSPGSVKNESLQSTTFYASKA